MVVGNRRNRGLFASVVGPEESDQAARAAEMGQVYCPVMPVVAAMAIAAIGGRIFGGLNHEVHTNMDTELEGLLNSLGEAERAGGRVLHELTDQAQSLELRELLRKVGHDEGYYAGELAAHVRRLGGMPSTKTGDFVEKVRAVGHFKDKLELLNRGQRWVVRKIGEQVGTITDARLQAFLRVMADGHDVNIGALDNALAEGKL